MSRAKSIFITLLLAISLACFVISIRIAWYSISVTREFRHAQSTPIITVPIDLSVRGETTFSFDLSYPAAHGVKVLVDGPSLTPNMQMPEPWLLDLRATLTGSAPESSSATEKIDPVTFPHDLTRGFGFDSNAIFNVRYVRTGSYTFTINVTTPAEQLAGKPHRLHVMHSVCGCETLGAFVGWIVAIPGLLQGVIVGITLLLRHNKRRTPNEYSSSSPVPVLEPKQ